MKSRLSFTVYYTFVSGGGIEDDAPSNPRKFGHGFEDANPDGTNEIICVINCWFVMTTWK
jgi:hypothetical protein